MSTRTDQISQSTSSSLPIESVAENIAQVAREICKIVVGQERTLEGVLIALLAGGHVLLEGVPGVGKTMMVRALAQAVSLTYSRIQFTPDLMPSDVLGTSIVQENNGGAKILGFQPGPIFANLLLADEINRATPKTQSALLEAMQERQVTVARTTHHLEEPFLVMATQNPLDMEGTYPLPEAQLDRFMFKLLVPFPKQDELHEILNRTTRTLEPDLHAVITGAQIMEMRRLVRSVPIAPHVQDYAVELVLATHPESGKNTLASRYIRYGSSPRGAQTLVLGAKVRALLQGRFNASIEDIRALLLPALRHRVILNFDAQADGRTADDLLQAIADDPSAREKAGAERARSASTSISKNWLGKD